MRYITALLTFIVLTPTLGQSQEVERSSFFRLGAGDRIEDAGVLRVQSGRFARSEAFEVVRRADGGRVVTSVITAGDNSYRVEGRWEYDANEQAVRADGQASYGSVPATVELIASAPNATISVESGDVERTLPASCDPDCLLDMAPSAVAMFSMTRQHTKPAGEIQTYRWLGQGLIMDQVLLEGTADMRLLKTENVDGTEVSHYHFTEYLTDAQTGEKRSFDFNLWVDSEHRPLAFGMTSGTLGVRDGYDSVPVAMPPVFD